MLGGSGRCFLFLFSVDDWLEGVINGEIILNFEVERNTEDHDSSVVYYA